MFSIDLTAEQLAVRDIARQLGREVLAPAARDAETAKGIASHVWATLIETGIVLPSLDSDVADIPDAVAHLLAVEELAAGDPASAASAVWRGNAAILISLCSGNSRRASRSADPRAYALAYLEGYGRRPSEYSTTIGTDGDAVIVRGRKVAVPFDSSVEQVLVVGNDARTGELRTVLLPCGPSATVTIADAHVHLGLDAAPLSSMSFDGTTTTDNLVGTSPGDAGALGAALSRIRLTTGALAVGGARRAHEYACEYVSGREAFGHTLSGFQGVAFLMADAEAQLEAAHLQLLDVAARIDHGETDLENETSHALAYAVSVATHVTRDCIQVLGGHGFITDHPVERWYRAVEGLASLDFDPTCNSFAPAL